MPHPIEPPATPADVPIEPYAGTYERAGVRIDVLATQNGRVPRTTVTGPLAELVPDPVSAYPMTPVATDPFAVKERQAQTWTPVTFYELRGGEKYMHFGARATPKAG